MKSCLLILLCLFTCAIQSHAQTGFIIGVNGGVNTTWIIYQDIYGEKNDNGISHQLKYTLTAAPAFGFQGGYALSSAFAIYAKPLFSSQGQNYATTFSHAGTSYVISRQVHLRYFKIPIEAQYTFGNDYTNLYVAGGLQMGYLRYANINAQYNGVSDNGNHTGSDALARFNKYDPGLVIEVEGSFLISQGLYFDAGLRCDFSIHDINSVAYHIPNSKGTYHHSYNSTDGLQIGIHYVFNNNSEF